MTEKIDFTRTLDSLQAPRSDFRIVDIPPMRYLMIDGQGDPNVSPAYSEALAAIYPVAYRIKFTSKRELSRDYAVPPLEGLWWADDPDLFRGARDKSRWEWTMMLMIPEWIDDEVIRRAFEQVGAKKPPARLDAVRVDELSEGTCVQTLHVGSFDDEGPVLARMHDEFIPSHGFAMGGTHHEIYLSDARRVAPERMRTILRQPVTPL